MKTIQEVIDMMTDEQKKAARKSLGDALDIVAELIPEIPYFQLFNITTSVIEKI